MTIRIGTSGWQYRDWRGTFYPQRMPVNGWLEYYSAAFGTVEVNNTFYKLPDAHVFAGWRDRTPQDFIVTVKANRFLSHIRRLKDPSSVIDRMMEATKHLGPKLGPVLVQLPPNLQTDVAALAESIDAFPPDIKLAFEFRHASWFTDETRRLMTEKGVALVWSDRDEQHLAPTWDTAGWGYVRFHSGTADPAPCYRRETLERRATELIETFGENKDVYVYFNNDPGGCAVTDACAFAEIVSGHGVSIGRTPLDRVVV